MLPPIYRFFAPLPQASVFNDDTGENNQYTITGTIAGSNQLERVILCHVRIYRFGTFCPVYQQQVAFGRFEFSHLPAGNYYVYLKSFSEKVYLPLNKHNPPLINLTKISLLQLLQKNLKLIF